jgi:hypothetical protein
LAPGEIAKLFSQQEASVEIVEDGFNAYVVVTKLDRV